MIGRVVLTALTALLVLVAVTSSSSPAPADGATRGASARSGEPAVRVSSTSVRIGERLTVRGRNFAPRTRVIVRLGGRRAALARTGRRGRFTVAFRVRRLIPGRHRLTVVARGTRLSRRISVLSPRSVSPPPAAPSPTATPSEPPPEPPVVAPPPVVTPAPTRAPAPVAAPDPVIAAAGDVACDPEAAGYNGGAGTSSSCRHRATANQLVGKGL